MGHGEGEERDQVRMRLQRKDNALNAGQNPEAKEQPEAADNNLTQGTGPRCRGGVDARVGEHDRIENEAIYVPGRTLDYRYLLPHTEQRRALSFIESEVWEEPDPDSEEGDGSHKSQAEEELRDVGGEEGHAQDDADVEEKGGKAEVEDDASEEWDCDLYPDDSDEEV
ncbi:hypothetical protein BT69DRAFT_1277811 [Atractiella rhizophila]|nr:hypothetical protein BT69DRAFT_1277811 [Atractiella rhizophila]